MILRNRTALPDKLLHKLIDFCDAGLGLNQKTVVVMHQSKGKSYGYSWVGKKHIDVWATGLDVKFPYEVNYDFQKRFFPVLATLPPPFDYFPPAKIHAVNWSESPLQIVDNWVITNYKEKIYVLACKRIKATRLNFCALSWEEDMINTIAHELRHQWQYQRHPLREWVYGCKNTKNHYKERDASAFAITKMREWRHLTQPREIYCEEKMFG